MLIIPVQINWDEFESKINTNNDTWTKSIPEELADFEDLDEDYQYDNFAMLGEAIAEHLDEKHCKAIVWLTSLLEFAGDGVNLVDYCDPRSLRIEDLGIPAYSPNDMNRLYEQSLVCCDPNLDVQIKGEWEKVPASIQEDTEWTLEQFVHNLRCWCNVISELKREETILGFKLY